MSGHSTAYIEGIDGDGAQRVDVDWLVKSEVKKQMRRGLITSIGLLKQLGGGTRQTAGGAESRTGACSCRRGRDRRREACGQRGGGGSGGLEAGVQIGEAVIGSESAESDAAVL